MTIKGRKVIYIADRKSADTKVLENAFREYEPVLRRFLRMRLALEEDREDLVQEIFLRLARSNDLEARLAEKTGNTLSYLFSIATNLIIDLKRRAAARIGGEGNTRVCETEPGEHLISELQPTPETAVQTQQQIHIIKHRLKTLNSKCRRAFILSRLKDQSYTEIARQMNVSVSSVEKYISTALSELREALNQEQKAELGRGIPEGRKL